MQAKRTVAPSRRVLLAALDREVRQASARGVLFSEAIARRLGITPTDLECIDIVGVDGRMTAGELARATGLTTGAITGVIDRLEHRGFARRERDPRDRRKVYVRILPKALQQAGRYYASLAAAMARLMSRYSDDDLALMIRFFAAAGEVMTVESARLATTGKVALRRSSSVANRASQHS
jgi:DNA-binding MarR family transcriptional regulator